MFKFTSKRRKWRQPRATTADFNKVNVSWVSTRIIQKIFCRAFHTHSLTSVHKFSKKSSKSKGNIERNE